MRDLGTFTRFTLDDYESYLTYYLLLEFLEKLKLCLASGTGGKAIFFVYTKEYDVRS